MHASIIFCVLAVLLCLLDRNSPSRRFGGLEMAFITLMFFLSIRYGFGNDYEGYLASFKEYASYTYGLTEFDKWATLHAHGEYGFVILNKLFQPVGFFGFIIFLSFFSLYALYRLIKTYVPTNWYWFAVFILAFNPSFLIVGIAGAIRQWIAVTIFIFTFEFIKKKKILFAILTMIVASTIHKTALAIIPFCLLPLLGINKFSKLKSTILIVFIVLWFLVIPRFGYILFSPLFQSDNMEFYTGYMAQDTGFSIFGVSSLLVIGIPFLCFSMIKRMNYDMRLMCLIMMCSVLFIPMVSVNVMIGRLAWYFSIFSIIVYPNAMELLMGKKQTAMVFIVVSVLVVYYAYLFITHFFDPVWYDTSYHFHTIFEQPWQ